jgi:palmitoyl-protein thioesterase
MQWFGEYNATSGKHTPLYKRDIFTEDWIGLKVLDDKDGLVFLEAEGPHVVPFFRG